MAVREAVQDAEEVDSPGGYRERKLTLEVEVVLTEGTRIAEWIGLLPRVGMKCLPTGWFETYAEGVRAAMRDTTLIADGDSA